MDKLVDCKRCGSNACYEQQVDEQVRTWLCMGCGFTTSTLLLEGSAPIKQVLENSPELYKDLLHKDTDGHIWMPATVTLPAKGMVFIDGSTKEDWKWTAVNAVEIPTEEQGKYPKGQTHKMDMKGAKHFSQREFMDALEVIGFYELG